MNYSDYLLSYGRSGDFGRFRSDTPLSLQRGDRLVIRSHRGVEIGEVLRDTAPRHAIFLPNTTVGKLLRPLTEDDIRTEAELRRQELPMLERANAIVNRLRLPITFLDVELLLDRQHAVLHHLQAEECDVRDLVSTFSHEFSLHVLLSDLTRANMAGDGEENQVHSCGSCGTGGCGSCGTGGCGTCGTTKKKGSHNHFADLRNRMERDNRVPLL